jgi:hypothetical protein
LGLISPELLLLLNKMPLPIVVRIEKVIAGEGRVIDHPVKTAEEHMIREHSTPMLSSMPICQTRNKESGRG